jgi:non-specific serine/threonine protein kinase
MSVETRSSSQTMEPRAAQASAAVFRKDGQYWTVAFDGTESRLKHSRGLSYLAELLRHPDRELHTLDLAVRFRGEPGDGAEAGAEDAGPLLDERAKAAYRERVEQVRAEIEEATALNDLGRAERARAELDVLTHELAAAVGLGRRDRKSASNAERSRVAVTKAVGAALKAIAEANPSLRRYLASTIKTGQFCSYTPDPRFPVTWILA